MCASVGVGLRVLVQRRTRLREQRLCYLARLYCLYFSLAFIVLKIVRCRVQGHGAARHICDNTHSLKVDTQLSLQRKGFTACGISLPHSADGNDARLLIPLLCPLYQGHYLGTASSLFMRSTAQACTCMSTRKQKPVVVPNSPARGLHVNGYPPY